MMIASALLHATTTDLSCEVASQPSTASPFPANILWKCPTIAAGTPGKLNATLSDVDLLSGNYTCDYYYVDTGKLATTCQYISTHYVSASKAKFKSVDTMLKQYKNLDFDKNTSILATFVPVSPGLGTTDTTVNTLETVVNTLTGTFKTKKTASTHLVGGKKTAKGISEGDPDINDILQMNYDHLVKPYISNAPNMTEKGDTLSRFLAGMITLDPEIVDGFNRDNGELKITPAWKTKTQVVRIAETTLANKVYTKVEDGFSWFFSLFGIGATSGIDDLKEGEVNAVDANTYNVSSWLDVFSMKIWGYYYNLQRRLDIGYDKLSMSLLFMFLVFFGGGLAIKGGTRFALGRRDGTGNQSFHLSDQGTLNVLSVMGAFIIFFVAIPSSVTSSGGAGVLNEPDITHEMRTNSSLIKTYIRYIAKEGSYFADMFSDLGTSAFLDYIIRKQGLYTGAEVKSLLDSNVRQMVYYYPSLQIADECEQYFGLDFHRFISKEETTVIGRDPKYAPTTFFQNNGIETLSYPLCAKVHKNLITIPNAIAAAAARADNRLDNASQTRAKSTQYLVQNHILLQEKLGWINSISVPFTYVMMREQDLFFEQGLDFEEIDKKTKAYVANLGLRDGSALKLSDTPLGEKVDLAVGSVRDNGSKAAAWATSLATNFAYYHFLPGFNTIHKNIKDSVYGVYGGDNSEKENKIKKKNKIKKRASEMLSKFANKIPMLGVLKKMLSVAADAAVEAIIYLAAMQVWKQAFIVIFLNLIILMVVFRILIYMWELFVHMIIAPFMVLWAFKGGRDVGVERLKSYARNTLVIGFSAILISIGTMFFIFLHDMFLTLDGLIVSTLIEQQMNLVSLAIQGSNRLESDAFLSYLTLYSVKDLAEIFSMMLGLLVAYMTLYRFEPFIKQQLGLDDNASRGSEQMMDSINRQGDRNVNPLTK
jgi:hypothetical protein